MWAIQRGIVSGRAAIDAAISMAGFAVVDHVAAGSSDANAVTTAGITTTGANLIVVAVGDYGLSAQTPPTDSKGNTPYSGLTLQDSASHARVCLYYFVAPTVGAGHTWSVSNSFSYPSLAVLALSGALSVSPFDVENGGLTAGAATLQPGSVTPGSNNEIVLSALCWDSSNGADSCSVNSGFTISDQLSPVSGLSLPIALAYKIQTSAAAVNPTWSFPSTDAAAVIGTWKSA